MIKRLSFCLLAVGGFLLVNISFSQSFFNSPNPTTPTTPAKPLSKDEFRNRVNSLSQQNQKQLSAQLNSRIDKKPVAPLPPPPPTNATNPTGGQLPEQQPVTPTIQAPAAAPPPQPMPPPAIEPSPISQAPATDQYTGFQAPNNQQKAGSTKPSGSGWDVRY